MLKTLIALSLLSAASSVQAATDTAAAGRCLGIYAAGIELASGANNASDPGAKDFLEDIGKAQRALRDAVENDQALDAVAKKKINDAAEYEQYQRISQNTGATSAEELQSVNDELVADAKECMAKPGG